MVKCKYSIGKPEIKKDEKEVYDELISDYSRYIDRKIIKKIRKNYNNF